MASAVKMSTASFYKGQAAIFAQALRAARSNGVLDLVLDDLRRHYPDLVEDAARQLQSIAAKSARFVPEMNEIAASQEAAGLTPDLFSAFAAVYRELSRTELAGFAPEDVDPDAELADVLVAMDEARWNGRAPPADPTSAPRRADVDEASARRAGQHERATDDQARRRGAA